MSPLGWEVSMSTILVEDLKEESLARLRAGADAHGKSLQAELQLILETAAEEQALRGWSREVPARKKEDDELDSVGLLEQYMATCWPNARGLT
jgi:plasmid stability protein